MYFPRMDLYEAKVGQDKRRVIHGMFRNWTSCVALDDRMVALDLKLTKKATSDTAGAGPPLPREEVERIL